MAMAASGYELEAEAREAARKQQAGTVTMGPSPALLKRRLAAKKKAAREAREAAKAGKP